MTKPLRLVRVEEPDLTKSEAQALDEQFDTHVNGAEEICVAMLRRRGYLALGHSSYIEWHEAKRIKHSRAHTFRLVVKARVEEIAGGSPVKESHARLLDKLPAEAIPRALEIARKTAADERGSADDLTLEIVRDAVAQVEAGLPAEDRKRESQAETRGGTPDEQADDRETKRAKWDRALAHLRETAEHGAKLAKALEAKNYPNIKDADVVLWAFDNEGRKRTSEEVRQIQNLVTSADAVGRNRGVKWALVELTAMPDAETRFARFHNIAIASESASTSGEIEGAPYGVVAADAEKWKKVKLARCMDEIERGIK